MLILTLIEGDTSFASFSCHMYLRDSMYPDIQIIVDHQHPHSRLTCNVGDLPCLVPGELSISGSESLNLAAIPDMGPTVEANEPLFLSPTGNLDAPNRINAANNQVQQHILYPAWVVAEVQHCLDAACPFISCC